MTTETSLPLKVSDPCPACGSPVHHFGTLFQPDPEAPALTEPVDLLRCVDCRRTWRADLVAYDQDAVSEAWRAYNLRCADKSAKR